ncbi:hypothetical protein M569_12946 [Genlisea aurea]|uniref:DYW domain-containing protein n=1 Tax=Genlisea aurea TaxID=192259 RepID=S8C519_9LAMI|nr:hypothetical protein M569_12946 [Genlisea aurea]
MVYGEMFFSKLPSGLPPHLISRFIKKYLDAGYLAQARRLFDEMSSPDVRSWTMLISQYVKIGNSREAILMYTRGKESGKVKPDRLAILAAIKACAVSGDLINGKKLHSDAIYYGFSSDTLLGNALIDMYGKCKCIEGAKMVFDGLTSRDLITWTSFCCSYVNCGLPRDSLRVFREMGSAGVKPNAITLSSVLPACSDLKCLKLGREIHCYCVKNGDLRDSVFVNSALMDMYSRCSSVERAESIFGNMKRLDVVSWNVMLSAYFRNGDWETGFRRFHELRRNRGLRPDVVSWNTSITGCVENGKLREGLELVVDMQKMGFKPNQITVASLLTACVQLEDWRRGKETHGYMIRHRYTEDPASSTALVWIYAKGGDCEAAERVFDTIPEKDTVAWNTMIAANAMHGKGKESLLLFETMLAGGAAPNSVTFTCVLSGCSHSKMVDEGVAVFRSMAGEHGIEPGAEHFSSVVDVLSRGGRLEEAYEFVVSEMSAEPTPSTWGALLGGCRMYKNVELGRIAAKRLFEIEPENPGNYVLFYNILVAAKLWEEASEVRRMMRDKGIRKVPGCSWIRVKNRIHTFLAGSKKNADELNGFVEEVRGEMRRAGHHPNTDFVLQDLDTEEEQERSLCGHSEKLAVAYGVLAATRNESSSSSTLRVFKNLRMCGDCHETIKFVSKSRGLRIVVRDSLRFHHFEEGSCSCRDFW